MRSSGIFARISRDSSVERKNSHQDFSDDITLNLNGNKLTFVENQWIAQSDNLDRAAIEIELIIEERDELLLSLEESTLHNEALVKEIIETNDMKNIALGMVRTTLSNRIQGSSGGKNLLKSSTIFCTHDRLSYMFQNAAYGREAEK